MTSTPQGFNSSFAEKMLNRLALNCSHLRVTSFIFNGSPTPKGAFTNGGRFLSGTRRPGTRAFGAHRPAKESPKHPTLSVQFRNMEENNLSRRMKVVMIVCAVVGLIFSILAMTGHGLHLLRRWHH
jgi:hypothetical protein